MRWMRFVYDYINADVSQSMCWFQHKHAYIDTYLNELRLDEPKKCLQTAGSDDRLANPAWASFSTWGCA